MGVEIRSGIQSAAAVCRWSSIIAGPQSCTNGEPAGIARATIVGTCTTSMYECPFQPLHLAVGLHHHKISDLRSKSPLCHHILFCVTVRDNRSRNHRPRSRSRFPRHTHAVGQDKHTEAHAKQSAPRLKRQFARLLRTATRIDMAAHPAPANSRTRENVPSGQVARVRLLALWGPTEICIAWLQSVVVAFLSRGISGHPHHKPLGEETRNHFQAYQRRKRPTCQQTKALRPLCRVVCRIPGAFGAVCAGLFRSFRILYFTHDALIWRFSARQPTHTRHSHEPNPRHPEIPPAS